jgi:hypothetical protein
MCTVPQFGPHPETLRDLKLTLGSHGVCFVDLTAAEDLTAAAVDRALLLTVQGEIPSPTSKGRVQIFNGKQVDYGKGGGVKPGREMCIVYKVDAEGNFSKAEDHDSQLSLKHCADILKLVAKCAAPECKQCIQEYTLKQVQYLRSVPECPRQPQHTDFETIESEARGKDGLTVLIALQENAVWYLKPYGYKDEIRVRVPRHWAIAFKGDVPHAGGELFKQFTLLPDVRYHMYLTKGTAAVPSNTYGTVYNFMPK